MPSVLRRALPESIRPTAWCSGLSKEEREYRLCLEAQRRRRAREREMRESENREREGPSAGGELDTLPAQVVGSQQGHASLYGSVHMDAMRACTDLRRSMVRAATIELEELLRALDQAAMTSVGLYDGDDQIDLRLHSSLARIAAMMDRSQALLATLKTNPRASAWKPEEH